MKKDILQKIKDIATDVLNLETVEAEVVKPEEEVKVELAQATLENGTVIEAESFEAGQPVFIVNEEERVALPVGEYEFEGGVLVVSEEGVIGEVKEKAAEEAPEEEMAAEYVTKDEFNEAINEIKSLFSAHKKESDEKVQTLEDEKTELQKVIDETPDAEPIVNKPKEAVELKQVPASDKKGRIYQFLNSKK